MYHHCKNKKEILHLETTGLFQLSYFIFLVFDLICRGEGQKIKDHISDKMVPTVVLIFVKVWKHRKIFTYLSLYSDSAGI